MITCRAREAWIVYCIFITECDRAAAELLLTQPQYILLTTQPKPSSQLLSAGGQPVHPTYKHASDMQSMNLNHLRSVECLILPY